MNNMRYIHFASRVAHWGLGLLVCTLLLSSCKNAVFTDSATCHENDGKIRIKASLLELAGKSSVRGYLDHNYVEADEANPFKAAEREEDEFERQIATLRVLGFYQADKTAQESADGKAHSKGDIAFNCLFANNKLLTSLDRTPKGGALVLPDPNAQKEWELEFQADDLDNFDVVLIANESLDATTTVSGTIPENKRFPNEVLTDKEGVEGEKEVLDLSTIQSIEELKKAFITAPSYKIAEDEGKVNYASAYLGALPPKAWLYANGGIPMVGQGSIKLSQYTGVQPIPTEPATIALERVLAKVEVSYGNTNDKDSIFVPVQQLQDHYIPLHLYSIALNNYPMYAMLLPSERSTTDRDYATPGTTHKHYSIPTSPFMDMYYAQEKAIAGRMPLTPASYKSRTFEELKEAPVCQPSCFIFGYKSPANDPILDVDWIPYIRPNALIISNGAEAGKAYYYYYPEGTESHRADYAPGVYPYEKKEYTHTKYRPTVLYVLPTTNDQLPAISGNGISKTNGETGVAQEPAEVVVTTGTLRIQNTFKNTLVNQEAYESPEWTSNGITYRQNHDWGLTYYHFRVFNRDEKGDKFALRRNTIYSFKIIWKGKDTFLAITLKSRFYLGKLRTKATSSILTLGSMTR